MKKQKLIPIGIDYFPLYYNLYLYQQNNLSENLKEIFSKKLRPLRITNNIVWLHFLTKNKMKLNSKKEIIRTNHLLNCSSKIEKDIKKYSFIFKNYNLIRKNNNNKFVTLHYNLVVSFWSYYRK